MLKDLMRRNAAKFTISVIDDIPVPAPSQRRTLRRGRPWRKERSSNDFGAEKKIKERRMSIHNSSKAKKFEGVLVCLLRRSLLSEPLLY